MIFLLQFLHYNQIILSTMRIKAGQRNQKTQKETKSKYRQYFDQEEENMDMLQMEEHHDPEYNELLKSHPRANLKKNAYFFNNERYSTVQQPDEQASDQDDQEEEEVDEPDDQPNQLANALKQLKQQRKKKSALLTEDIHRIDEQDQEFQTLRKKQKTSEQNIQESIQLKNQLQLYKDLVDIRYHKQNELESIKRFPHRNFIKDKTLNSEHKQLQAKLFENLNQLFEVYNNYAIKVYNIPQTNGISEQYHSQLQAGVVPERSRLNIQDIYKHFIAGQEKLVKQTERELVRWSQKTTLINVSSSHYSSLLMQTPIGQTKKVLANWERVCAKSQNKRSTFKVLFQDDENIRVSNDSQIFDDFDLFNELEKVYVSQIEDDNDFRISDTLQYLKNRQGRGQKKKEVDRKASKNRKIRFNVHAKLLNFMPSKPEVQIEARDEIVSNIFNCRSNQQLASKPEDGETYYIDM